MSYESVFNTNSIRPIILSLIKDIYSKLLLSFIITSIKDVPCSLFNVMKIPEYFFLVFSNPSPYVCILLLKALNLSSGLSILKFSFIKERISESFIPLDNNSAI